MRAFDPTPPPGEPMNPPSPSPSAREIFDAALKLAEAPARAAYLDQACAGNAALRADVESLLAAHEQAGDFLGKTLRLPETDFVIERTGTMIGRYKVLQKIGEGGFGVVYMAEQIEPVQRKVAVKIIKAGMDTHEVVARFEAERQALALMDHPNIARVLDAGATEAGRPYFVMELVNGIPITDYCDREQLPTTERLQLFMKVCHAVQHAHQKGIIHRDLKPNNVLVTLHDGEPVPKVIDFGVAKALGQKLTEKTLFTAFQHMIGTPAYMSPEQADLSGLDIDTRADIYSLGVLLYELLTGATPFDAETLRQAALDEVRRMIRETEPPKPSTRLRTLGEKLPGVAQQRQTEPALLRRLVRGDLDWIVMKALEKDRRRRYETPDAFASDVARHLNSEPVLASPPSVPYLVGKFMRRHQAGLAVAAALLLLLLAGAAVSTWQAVRATRAEQEQSRLRLEAETARDLAKEQEQLARRQQRLTSEQELLARRRFYAAQVNLASQAVEARQFARALDLLENQRPRPGQEDLRTFEWHHLWGRCNARLRLTIHAPNEPVFAVAFSPDGGMLASAGWGGVVRLWETRTGRKRSDLKLVTGNPVYAMIFTPDGRTVATGNWDGMVRLWDSVTGQLRATLRGQNGWVRCLAVSPDGNLLACGGDDGIVKLFDLATSNERLRFYQNDVVVALAFSPDGTTLASGSPWGSHTNLVKLWDVSRGLPAPKLEIATPAWTLGFSPDGKVLATARWTDVQLWDPATGQLRATLKGPLAFTTCLTWLPHGESLVSAGLDRTVRRWRLYPPKDSAAENDIIGEHLDSVLSLAVSQDGKMLASSANDGSIRLWNLEPSGDEGKTELVSQFQFGTGQTNVDLSSLAFSPDGNTLFGVMRHGTAARNMVSGQINIELAGASGRGALSPDGSLLATGGRDGMVRLWDLPSGRLLASVHAHAHTSGVSDIAFSPDGRMLATCCLEDPVLKMWNPAAALELLWTLDTASAGVSALVFSPDAKTLAAIKRHHAMMLTDSATGELNYSFSVVSGYSEVYSIMFSPNGKLLATGSDSATVKLWDVDTRSLRYTLKGHVATIRSLVFSHDGGTLVTAGDDLMVRFWDVLTGQERITLQGCRASVKALAFSPDGNTLAVGDADGLVWLWRANHGAEAATYAEQETDTDWAKAGDYNSQAWVLATDPDSRYRDGQRAVRLAERAVAVTWRESAAYLDTLAAAYAETGQFTNAIRIQQEAIALLQNENEKSDYTSRLRLYESNLPCRDHNALAARAKALLDAGKFAEAEPLARKCLALREVQIPGDWRTFNTRSMLGGALLGQKKHAEAEPLLLSGYEGMKVREEKIPSAGRARIQETLQRLAELYENTDHPDKAAEWRQKLANFGQDEAMKKQMNR
jgi:WD40 repeat protein/serine/threonine protein kinase